MFTDTTRQRDARQSAGPERYLVCRQAGVQMARAAQAVRQKDFDVSSRGLKNSLS